MIRETLGARSKHAMMVFTAANFRYFQYRAATGGVTECGSAGKAAPPQGVRLRRSGNVLTGSLSNGGDARTIVGTVTISMAHDEFVGLAVTVYCRPAAKAM